MEQARKIAEEIKRKAEITEEEKHIAFVTEKILDKLEPGEPLLLSTVEVYRVSSRKSGAGARKVIREVLRELGVEVSSGYRIIATMMDKETENGE